MSTLSKLAVKLLESGRDKVANDYPLRTHKDENRSTTRSGKHDIGKTESTVALIEKTLRLFESSADSFLAALAELNPPNKANVKLLARKVEEAGIDCRDVFGVLNNPEMGAADAVEELRDTLLLAKQNGGVNRGNSNTPSTPSFNNGDIVTLTGYLERDGYWRVDTQDAIGSSPERPWVGSLDDNSGAYVDPSNLDCLNVVISSDDYDTESITSSEQVERILDGEDEEDDW